jgi:hypothetical protein
VILQSYLDDVQAVDAKGAHGLTAA